MRSKLLWFAAASTLFLAALMVTVWYLPMWKPALVAKLSPWPGPIIRALEYGNQDDSIACERRLADWERTEAYLTAWERAISNSPHSGTKFESLIVSLWICLVEPSQRTSLIFAGQDNNHPDVQAYFTIILRAQQQFPADSPQARYLLEQADLFFDGEHWTMDQELALKEPHLGDHARQQVTELEIYGQGSNRPKHNLTDAGMVHIGRLTSLKTLQLHGTSITDQGVKSLVTLDKLESVYLNRSPLTDAIIETIALLPNLKEFDIKHTLISEDGLMTLRKRLPQCRVDGKRWQDILDERQP